MLCKYFIGLIKNLVSRESSAGQALRNWAQAHSVQGAGKLAGFSEQDSLSQLFIYSLILPIQRTFAGCVPWGVHTSRGKAVIL